MSNEDQMEYIGEIQINAITSMANKSGQIKKWKSFARQCIIRMFFHFGFAMLCMFLSYYTISLVFFITMFYEAFLSMNQTIVAEEMKLVEINNHVILSLARDLETVLVELENR